MTFEETARELHQIDEALALLDVCCSDDDVEDWLRLQDRREHLLSLASEPRASSGNTVVDLALWRERRAAASPSAALAAVI